MKHLKIFETVAAFEEAQATLDLPNVSLIEATNGINYLPYVEPINPFVNDPYIDDPKLVVIYNVTSTNEDTLLFIGDYKHYINSMEIDSVQLNNVTNTYRFNTTGEHVVKYDYNDNSLKQLFYSNNFNIIIPPNSKKIYIPTSISSLGEGYTFWNNTSIEFISIPNTFDTLTYNAFENCSNLSSIRCAATTAPQIEDSSNSPFQNIAANGTLYVPTGATGYDVWLTALGSGWTKVEF